MTSQNTSSSLANTNVPPERFLEELRKMNATLLFIQQRLDLQHQQQSAALEQLTRLVDGFTSGGASFGAYQVDQLTAAYLAIMGPLLAAKLAVPGQPTALDAMFKGALFMAKELLEELGAYRSHRAAADYLERQAEFINDPWKPAEGS